MPSSDRKPKRDRPEQKSAPRAGGRGRHADRPVQPPQYFEHDDAWDSQAAEALTRLYESGEGYVHSRPDDQRRRPRQLPQPTDQPSSQGPAQGTAQGIAEKDRLWLDARLSDIADRLQASLAKINPDKAVDQLTHRLDMIEERFSEVLDRVAQRSDLDGLKLIEAHVFELASHVEQNRSRLERIDSIDERVQGIAQKLEEGDHQRLDALEKVLQDYITEWRKNDTRTVTVLQQLEGAVNRVGESIEALEAHRPVPDLSLSMLNTPATSPARGTDPISQVYAEAARSLEPDAAREVLDAASYAPKVDPAASAAEDRPSSVQAAQEREEPDPEEASASLRGIREKLRQAGLLAPEDDPDGAPTGKGTPDEEAHRPEQQPSRIRRFGPNLLLTGSLVIFGLIGYLLVDVLMGASAVRHAGAAANHTATSGSTRAAPARPAADSPAPEPAASEIDRESPPETDGGTGRILPPLKPAMIEGPARIEGIGSAMAAAFRGRELAPVPEATASIHKETPAFSQEQTPGLAALPMTIGPASLRQAALRGNVPSQVEVAARFAAGQGVERDLAQALQWYGRAAAQGSAVAQYRLAAFYERGWGAPRDVERARVWYARAADQGNVKAMHNLGVLTVSGGRADYAAAATWFIKAAAFGLTDSQVNLAILCQNGLGVPKDLVQAYKWLSLASRRGDREAAGRISRVKAELNPEDLATAEAAAAAWRPHTPDPGANESGATVTLDSSG